MHGQPGWLGIARTVVGRPLSAHVQAEDRPVARSSWSASSLETRSAHPTGVEKSPSGENGLRIVITSLLAAGS
jgi:hypothetical protein